MNVKTASAFSLVLESLYREASASKISDQGFFLKSCQILLKAILSINAKRRKTAPLLCLSKVMHINETVFTTPSLDRMSRFIFGATALMY